MSPLNFLCTLLLLAVVSNKAADASLPSIGLETVEPTRLNLPDSAFHIKPQDQTVTMLPNTRGLRIRSCNVGGYPAMGAADVQTLIAYIDMDSGVTIPEHTHPRASENLYVVAGTVRTRFDFEGGRVVRNLVRAGEATLYPQGLKHRTKCISPSGCQVVASFNSADPGFVFM